MKDKKFVFAGNRAFVLESMWKKGLDVAEIFAVKNSYLQRALEQKGERFHIIESRKQFINHLENLRFDFFIANGCPYILPVSNLKDGKNQFLNIHPSYLPDLRGADPVPAAILFARDSGATCHVMDDGVDTGPIIARVKIPYSADLDCGLLYQLSFEAERKVFFEAYKREFLPVSEQEHFKDGLYYSLRKKDLNIDFGDSSQKIISRIKAFCTASQGARFYVNGKMYRVFDAEIVRNSFLSESMDKYSNNQVVFKYERSILFRHGEEFVKFKSIEGDLSSISIGQVLGHETAGS